MSEVVAAGRVGTPRPLPPAWSRDARPPAAPVRAPANRHPALEGLAAFDWQWRHRFALRALQAQLAQATATATPAPVHAADSRVGDLEVAALHDALAALAPDSSLREPALALLLGAYVALPAADAREAVALAAAGAVRLGIPVHVVCAEPDAAAALAARIGELTGPPATDAAGVLALREQLSASAVAAWPARGAVCGPLNVLAHGWLRLGGSSSAVSRAASALGGEPPAAFPFAPLLLVADGDALLLDVVRQPVQITDDVAEDTLLLAQQAGALVKDWQEGRDYSGDTPTGEGAAQVARLAEVLGGVWAVPRVRDLAVQAALVAGTLAEGKEYRVDGARIHWLLADAVDAERRDAVERALLCRHGKGSRRVRRRASLLDFLAGYARLGAAGAVLGGEWRDLWLLHGIPVWQPATPAPALQWLDAPAASLLAADGGPALFVANRRLVEEGGPLPADLPVLDQADARAKLAAALAAGDPVRVVGLPVALRLVPPGVSAIILTTDDPTLPAWMTATVKRLLRAGRAGRALATALASLARWRLERQRYQLRRELARRREQERRTWAFAAGAHTIEQDHRP